jgi:hypothetical protein
MARMADGGTEKPVMGNAQCVIRVEHPLPMTHYPLRVKLSSADRRRRHSIEEALMATRAAKGKKRKRQTPRAGGKARSARFARMEKELGIDANEGALGAAMDWLFPATNKRRKPSP